MPLKMAFEALRDPPMDPSSVLIEVTSNKGVSYVILAKSMDGPYDPAKGPVCLDGTPLRLHLLKVIKQVVNSKNAHELSLDLIISNMIQEIAAFCEQAKIEPCDAGVAPAANAVIVRVDHTDAIIDLAQFGDCIPTWSLKDNTFAALPNQFYGIELKRRKAAKRFARTVDPKTDPAGFWKVFNDHYLRQSRRKHANVSYAILSGDIKASQRCVRATISGSEIKDMILLLRPAITLNISQESSAIHTMVFRSQDGNIQRILRDARTYEQWHDLERLHLGGKPRECGIIKLSFEKD